MILLKTNPVLVTLSNLITIIYGIIEKLKILTIYQPRNQVPISQEEDVQITILYNVHCTTLYVRIPQYRVLNASSVCVVNSMPEPPIPRYSLVLI